MFKPGWKDIFRMNQSELEAEIRKVSQDSTLDPRRKAYLIQNLMTRFVILKLQQINCGAIAAVSPQRFCIFNWNDWLYISYC